jgi:tRNA(Leu) C34 or U34 (ribose-2'-O)-methylase TrmL
MYAKITNINSEDFVSEEKYLKRNGLNYTTYALLHEIKAEQSALKKIAKKNKLEKLMKMLAKNRANMSTSEALQQDIIYEKYGLTGVIEKLLSNLLEERKNMSIAEALRQDVQYETNGLFGVLGK